jgi:ferric iron reductase protein FhuF
MNTLEIEYKIQKTVYSLWSKYYELLTIFPVYIYPVR